MGPRCNREHAVVRHGVPFRPGKPQGLRFPKTLTSAKPRTHRCQARSRGAGEPEPVSRRDHRRRRVGAPSAATVKCRTRQIEERRNLLFQAAEIASHAAACRAASSVSAPLRKKVRRNQFRVRELRGSAGVLIGHPNCSTERTRTALSGLLGDSPGRATFEVTANQNVELHTLKTQSSVHKAADYGIQAGLIAA